MEEGSLETDAEFPVPALPLLLPRARRSCQGAVSPVSTPPLSSLTSPLLLPPPPGHWQTVIDGDTGTEMNSGQRPL